MKRALPGIGLAVLSWCLWALPACNSRQPLTLKGMIDDLIREDGFNVDVVAFTDTQLASTRAVEGYIIRERAMRVAVVRMPERLYCPLDEAGEILGKSRGSGGMHASAIDFRQQHPLFHAIVRTDEWAPAAFDALVRALSRCYARRSEGSSTQEHLPASSTLPATPPEKVLGTPPRQKVPAPSPQVMPSNAVVGMYRSASDGATMSLMYDRTAFYREDGKEELTGKYQVDGRTVTVTPDNGTVLYRCRISGVDLIGEDRRVWKRR
jgi:hypothetical protein